MTFATARSALCWTPEISVTRNSGIEVPNDTTVSPATIGDTTGPGRDRGRALDQQVRSDDERDESGEQENGEQRHSFLVGDPDEVGTGLGNRIIAPRRTLRPRPSHLSFVVPNPLRRPPPPDRAKAHTLRSKAD
jgi:hypothetical protein